MKKRFIAYVAHRYVSTVGAPGDAGDFTEAQHLAFLLKAEEKWDDGKYADDLQANVDAAVQLLNNQTARFDELDNPAKDNIVNLTWLKYCHLVASDHDRAEDCDIEGDELSADAKEYELDKGQKFTFSVDQEKVRTGIYEVDEQVAIGLLKADKELSEYIAKQVLISYKAFAGPNIPAIRGLSGPMSWDGGNTTTNIPAASYNIGIIASLLKQMQLNKVKNGFFVNSGSLFEAWTNAMLNGNNLDGKGDDLRLKQIKLQFDMWNFLEANLTEDMFLVDKSAVALKTYTRYSLKPDIIGGKVGQTRYKMASRLLPGVEFDVIYEVKCIAGKIKYTWQVSTQFGIWLNPEPCPITINVDGVPTEFTPTGVYSFTKTA